MEWISVKDSLPVIPNGKQAVEVIVAEYDHGEPGYTVHSVMYGYCPKSEIQGEFTGFMQLMYGSKLFLGPLFDEVTHWMYMPEAPEYK